jgi:hypothetical protein
MENIEDTQETALANVPSLGAEVASARAAQEVQAAMVIAKKFPRDENKAYAAIIQSCKRKTLAEAAIYSYPRGGSTVEGPSIRLAEEMARNWGNLDYGLVELEQTKDNSVVMAFAWDQQTGTRRSMVFTVPHVREVGRGQNKTLKALDDPRDVYEIVANMGARRMRACIMALIPGDFIDGAVEECNRTMADAEKGVSLQDRCAKMVAAFSDFGVTQDMIEKKFQHRLGAITEAELNQLRKIYRAIADSAASREQFFDVEQGAARPPAPVREAKGAAAAVAPEREPTPAPAPVPTVTPEVVPEKPKGRATPPAKEEQAAIADVAKEVVSATTVKEPRTKLAPSEKLTVKGVVSEIVTLKINKQPSIKATIDTDGFKGIVYHIGGATVTAQIAQADGKVVDKLEPLPVWQKEKAVTIELVAKTVASQPDPVVFVEKIVITAAEEDGINF